MAWICSNEKCSNTSKREKGSQCPTCGSPVQEYKYGRLFTHLSLKTKRERKPLGDAEQNEKKNVQGSDDDKETLFSPEMTDEQLEEFIRRDLRSTTVPHHRWSDIVDLIEDQGDESGDSLMLAALFNQSRILIFQNELIIRILRRAFPGTSPTAPATTTTM